MKFSPTLKTSIFTLLLCLFCTNYGMEKNETILYKQGTEKDLEQLLDLYEKIDKNEEDKSKLVVFPKKIRASVVLGALQSKEIYVAQHKETDTIVGFTKLFVLDKNNVSETLKNELNFVDNNLLLNTCYELPIKNYSEILGLKLAEYQTKTKLENPENFYSGNESCSYIYYGGAYTDPEYRNSGINTNLITTGFQGIGKLSSASCALLYGQVEKNKNQTGMIKAFAYCMTQHYNPEKTISLFHLQHTACKPEFIINKEDKLEPIFFEKNKGAGNIVIFNALNKKE